MPVHYPSRDWWRNKRVEPTGGVLTEVYSEVLAQVCLSYSILNNGSALNWWNLVDEDSNEEPRLNARGNVIPKRGWYTTAMARLIELPRGRSLGTGSTTFATQLVNYALDKVVARQLWVTAQGRNMAEIKRIYNIGSNYKIYNDKIFGNGNDSPYKVFRDSIRGVRDDKWNPADIWVMTKEGKDSIVSMNRNNFGLPTVNNFFIEQYKEKNIIPISLKKPQASFHYEVINTNEFYGRLVFGRTNNPTVEFTDGNKDVKFNFTIETVELPKGMTTERASRSGVPGGRVVDSKNIRLKYTADGNQLELEYDQSGRGNPKYAEAKMGKLGTANIKQIVDNTTRRGVNKLRDIQNNYTDKTFSNSTNGQEEFLPANAEWYKLDQLGGGKPRRNTRIDDNNRELHNLFSEYVSELWEEIGNAPPMLEQNLKDRFNASGQKLSTSKEFWSKSRAGELGVAIGSSGRDIIKRRLLQNLYDVAASIAYGQGLTKTEQIIARNSGDITRFSRGTSRNVQFRAGPYVKVY